MLSLSSVYPPQLFLSNADYVHRPYGQPVHRSRPLQDSHASLYKQAAMSKSSSSSNPPQTTGGSRRSAQGSSTPTGRHQTAQSTPTPIQAPNPRRSHTAPDGTAYEWNRFAPYPHAPLGGITAGYTNPDFSSLSFTTRRSPSVVSEASSRAPSEAARPRPRPLPTPANVGSHATSSRPVSHNVDRDLTAGFNQMRIKTEEAAQQVPASSRPSSSRRPATQSRPSPHSEEEAVDGEWTTYARAVDIPGVGPQYTCVWPDESTGRTHSCGYTSKKHLVKRHIESRHLQLRPLECHICGKRFSQKSNLSTHINTHTGAEPHHCPYEGCDATFGDPARRHRHMKSVHGHVSKSRRTQGGGANQGGWSPEEEDSP